MLNNLAPLYYLKIIRKILALLKQEGTILNSMTQAREKQTFEWYEHAMVYRVFIFVFLFRNKVIREQLDESDFRRCYGNFFLRKCHSESIWSQLCSKYFINNYENLDNGIWKTPYNWRFYGYGCQACTKTFNLLLHASLSLKQA